MKHHTASVALADIGGGGVGFAPKTRAVVKRFKVKTVGGYESRVEYNAGDIVIHGTSGKSGAGGPFSSQSGWTVEYKATLNGWEKVLLPAGAANLEVEDLRILPNERRVKAIADWPDQQLVTDNTELDLLSLRKDHTIVVIDYQKANRSVHEDGLTNLCTFTLRI